MSRHLLPHFLLLFTILVAQPPCPNAFAAAESHSFRINTDQRLSGLQLERHNGTLQVRLETSGETVPAQTYLEQLYLQQNKDGENLFFLIFNITSWVNFFWVVLGLLGQAFFTGRMVVQWIVSEKQHRSVVPVAFWWMSLGGASMLLLYFIWRKDIVGILGQSTGLFIYLRNLWLIYSEKQSSLSAS